MWYRLLRPLLFLLAPETAHKFTFTLLQLLYRLRLTKLFFPPLKNKPVTVAGLHFKNPIGVAAGLDKNGDYIAGLASLGVGFIEIGGVTPRPQPGNPKPRIQRLLPEQALINWMGLNNKGIDHLVENLKQAKVDCLIGVNLAKNHATPNEQAAQDYFYDLEKIYPHADFAVINVSCPNSSEIQALQTETHLAHLLHAIKNQRDKLQHAQQKPLPLFIKISPDLTQFELDYLIDTTVAAQFDGIIATNTSIMRDNIAARYQNLRGGLSGAPLRDKSEHILKHIKQRAPQLPVISVGGIMSAKDAQRRFELDADLIQLYTGLIYQGPRLIDEILKIY